MSRLKSLRPLYPSNKLYNVRYCVIIACTHSSRMKNACSKFILVVSWFRICKLCLENGYLPICVEAALRGNPAAVVEAALHISVKKT
jgi:hypothetical protein